MGWNIYPMINGIKIEQIIRKDLKGKCWGQVQKNKRRVKIMMFVENKASGRKILVALILPYNMGMFDWY